MFSRSHAGQKGGPFESLVGKGMTITGSVKSKGSLRIEGIVEGDIQCQGDVAIGDGATVNADVQAHDVTISGSVKGNIQCSGRLELLPSARVCGDVSSIMLVVAEGAFFHGNTKVAQVEKRGLPSRMANIENPSE
ncbi:MAG: bactofilin family protein [Bacillota bacterium]|jgi:cytoskeletal protein CcmA (bactofilin family)